MYFFKCLPAGGVTLTVNGYGFEDNAMVYVGSGSCDVIDVTPASITCKVPPSVSSHFFHIRKKGVILCGNSIDPDWSWHGHSLSRTFDICHHFL